MRVLVLDDDMSRHGAFARNLSEHEVTHVMTHDDAVHTLRARDRFDVIYLDHDLNDFEFESKGISTSMYGSDDRDLTGADVCRFIAKEMDRSKLLNQFIVHSVNEDGAKVMKSILDQTGVETALQPFTPTIGS